ncbi:hypothetical protein ABT282_08070 [Streptomyces sp. NPDC000927]|uniref:hypothetical protein n=1 Tax=Streptomyces sp. NPDC000927 TaxID=3154371 RepID=UPI003328259D
MSEKTDKLGRSETYLKALNQSEARLTEHCETVVNPEVPEEYREILLGNDDPHAKSWDRSHSFLLWSSLGLGMATIITAGPTFPHWAYQATGGSAIGTTSLLIGTLVTRGVISFNKWNKASKAIPQGNYILPPADLNPAALDILKRTQEARRAILASASHQDNIVDRARNEAALPDQEWAIAKALLSYTKASAKIDRMGDEKTGEETAKVIRAHEKALATGLKSITTKVEALEAYAQQLKRLDERHTDLQRALKLSESNSDLMDLLASTGADKAYLSQIKDMNDEAKALSEVFSKALREAQQAALVALPEAGAA